MNKQKKAKRRRRTLVKTCSICVHGYDLSVFAESMVVCPPQRKVHFHDYACTGFRKITFAEIDERTSAEFGISNKEVSVER